MDDDAVADYDLEKSKLELAQRAADEAEHQSRFQRRLKLVELKERRSDRELKRAEIENASGRGIRFTSAQATVAAAALAVVSAIAGGLIQSMSSKDIEEERSEAQLEIERLRAQAAIDLEAQKQLAAERLERAEFETTLILKAIEAPNKEEQIKNLKFFLNAGFITDDEGKIAAIDENDFPSLPRPSNLTDGTVPDIVDKILNTVGLSRNFSVVQTTEEPSVTSVVVDGKPLLRVNPEFLAEVSGKEDDWARILILSHEVAHHLLGHLTTGRSSSLVSELEADEFACFVLGKCGAPVEALSSIAERLFVEEETRVYPARSARLAALQAGWSRANGSAADIYPKKEFIG